MALAQRLLIFLLGLRCNFGGSIMSDCPGKFEMPGYGPVHLRRGSGWGDVKLSKSGKLISYMGARAYFADECTAGSYDHKQYLALNLLGKTMRYTVDLRDVGCGCNAAMYLTSLRQNTEASECLDYYCDANKLCGESCAEIDIQEGNQFAWHSTLHTATDHEGMGGGFGGAGSRNDHRDWSSEEYGKGAKCIDTSKPFEVAASFPVDSHGSLAAMEVVLSQAGSSCPLSVRVGSYEGMAEISKALKAGMTPIVMYWSANDMLWMDGVGADGQGPCKADDMDACGESVKFDNFSVEDIGSETESNAAQVTGDSAVECPGKFDLAGYGQVELIPAGWTNGNAKTVDVLTSGELIVRLTGRAYFADKCTAGKYDNEQYLALNLLGKTMRYTVDLTDAGCGCNVALYLTSLKQNTEISECSDYYCDANNVCGESCAEIDIQEGNQFAWHSTLHSATDHGGIGVGLGGGDSWNGPRDWSTEEYGKGAKCIDTSKPFEVAASFPVDSRGSLAAMEVVLSQSGSSCPLSVRIGSYEGMAEISKALEAGMTPIVSYWSANDMLWMDGRGTDGKGPCEVDDMDACAEAIKFHNFSVASIGSSVPTECAITFKEDCTLSHCCQAPGMQCFEKDETWAACKEVCVPGTLEPEDPPDQKTPWSCRPLGSRTQSEAQSTVSSSTTTSGVTASSSEPSSNSAAQGTMSGTVTITIKTGADLPESAAGQEASLLIDGDWLRAQVLVEASDRNSSSPSPGREEAFWPL